MFHPKNLDTMNYQQLYKLQSEIVQEYSTYEQQETWTHYGLTSNSFTHAHLKRKKIASCAIKNFTKQFH